jgi:phospholipid/cholesterol/gamma-HCH transport system substrate-binding protein
MKKRSREIRVAILVLVSVALLYYGLNYLKGNNIFSNNRVYYAIYDHVDGLSVDNTVVLNGFKVGKVSTARLIPESGDIEVGFTIFEENLRIPRNSVAKIVSLDLLGTKAITLEFSTDSVIAVAGDTLLAGNEMDLQSSVDERIKPLEEKTKQLLGSIDSAVVIVQSILNKEARENLSASFVSIKRSFQSFEKTAISVNNLVESETAKISGIITNVGSITKNFQSNNKSLTNIINKMSAVTDSLAEADLARTVIAAQLALESTAQVLDKINRGEGTIGELVNNDTLYNNLEQSALELDKLLEDLRVNPKRYVHFSIFGKRDKDKPELKPRE